MPSSGTWYKTYGSALAGAACLGVEYPYVGKAIFKNNICFHKSICSLPSMAFYFFGLLEVASSLHYRESMADAAIWDTPGMLSKEPSTYAGFCASSSGETRSVCGHSAWHRSSLVPLALWLPLEQVPNHSGCELPLSAVGLFILD